MAISYLNFSVCQMQKVCQKLIFRKNAKNKFFCDFYKNQYFSFFEIIACKLRNM